MDRPAIIRKTAADLRLPPNLSDYDAQCRAFSWDGARAALQGLPGGGLNIAFEAVDRRAELRELLQQPQALDDPTAAKAAAQTSAP